MLLLLLLENEEDDDELEDENEDDVVVEAVDFDVEEDFPGALVLAEKTVVFSYDVLVCLESVGDVLDVFEELLVVVFCSCVGCGVEDFSDVVEDVTVVEVIGDFVEELVLVVEELVEDEDTIVGVPAVSVVSGPGVLTFFVD